MANKVPRRRKHAKDPTEYAIMLTIQHMVDPETGEMRKVFVPAYPIDRRVISDRGFHLHDLILADLWKDRNPRFWRKFHSLSIFLADNVDELSGMAAHDALKHVQLQAGVWCERARYELEDGTPIYRTEPKSLAFKTADESVALEVWEKICDYVAETYFPDWTPDQMNDAREFWERQQ